MKNQICLLYHDEHKEEVVFCFFRIYGEAPSASWEKEYEFTCSYAEARVIVRLVEQKLVVV